MVIDTATMAPDHSAVVDFEVKTVSAERKEIEGYASTRHLDLVGNRIEPGAFARSIREKGPAGIAVIGYRVPAGGYYHDRDFAQGWDAGHPGGGDRCACRGHRLWRGDLEAGAPA